MSGTTFNRCVKSLEVGKNLLSTVREIEDGGLSLARRCELLGVNRSSVYYTPAVHDNDGEIPKPESLENEVEAKEAMMAIIDETHTDLPASGSRKMVEMIRRAGYECTRYRAGKLMEEMNIKPVYPKPNLSRPGKNHPKFPYLLRGKRIWLPNQVWAIDITYVRCGTAHMYLTVIIDWYSRMIMGWMLSDSLDAAPVVECAKAAIKRWGAPGTWNSDQGIHFSSTEYIELLAAHGIAQSMDGKGRWVENVIVERVFRTIKSEHLKTVEYETPRELRQELDTFITKYNERRLHQSLDYITPRECFEAAFKNAA